MVCYTKNRNIFNLGNQQLNVLLHIKLLHNIFVRYIIAAEKKEFKFHEYSIKTKIFIKKTKNVV